MYNAKAVSIYEPFVNRSRIGFRLSRVAVAVDLALRYYYKD